MSLPRRERRALRKIEAGISRSDPGLAQLLGDFQVPDDGLGMQSEDRRHTAVARACSVALTVAGSAARPILRGTLAAVAAVCAPGVRERLGVRERPQSMARSSWQRLT